MRASVRGRLLKEALLGERVSAQTLSRVACGLGGEIARLARLAEDAQYLFLDGVSDTLAIWPR